ncbi:MAG: tetratricopeptide repeat protein, partial [Betaproteobacteria bacterium]|nr:tetratricopeptide repeat protein [Betaproteobacteria bacterium]
MPPIDLAATLARALALHQRGEVVEAEQLYQAILKAQPRNFHALHLSGVARAQQGRPDEAVQFFKKALAREPKSAEANCNYGTALQSLNRHDEALASYAKALAVRPQYAEALTYRGNSLQALNRHAEAIASYDRALAAQPNYAEAHYHRGNALQALNRPVEAIAGYERALALQSGYAKALVGRADALLKLERHAEALADCDSALALAPDSADAHNLRGNALQGLERHAEAIASYDRALAIMPGRAETYFNRGSTLQALNRQQDALADYDSALALKPEYADAHNNRGNALDALNRPAEAAASYARAIAIDPGHADAHANRSLACLRNGDLAPGWAEDDWRWRKRGFLLPNIRLFSQPEWPGPAASPGQGKLLVWGEQGLGDEILHAIMLPDLLAAGMELVVETDHRLVQLFGRSFPGAAVVPRLTIPHDLTRDPAIKFQTPLASLGRWLRPNWQAFPERRGFLVPDLERAAQLRQEVKGANRGPVIGIAWKSKGLAHKSLNLPDLAPVIAAGEAVFVNLQYGDTQAERESLRDRAGRELLHLDSVDLFNDLDGIAALIHACDLIITTSNVVAHFAGALGKPVWILLPAGNGLLWYWFRDTAASPWY